MGHNSGKLSIANQRPTGITLARVLIGLSGAEHSRHKMAVVASGTIAFGRRLHRYVDRQKTGRGGVLTLFWERLVWVMRRLPCNLQIWWFPNQKFDRRSLPQAD